MFLGQVVVESDNLKDWLEGKDNTPESYFINEYWKKSSRWTGLGASRATEDGLTLRVPTGKGAGPAEKRFELYWAKGPDMADSPTFIVEQRFKKFLGYYEYDFPGGVAPKYTTHLLVVDPDTAQVVLAIKNKMQNWQPQDVLDFRGRGPIQLTGRYNYQKFADSMGAPPELMTNPALLSDRTVVPEPGVRAATWFWASHNLNGITSGFEYAPATDLNFRVSREINGLNKDTGRPNAEDHRLMLYRRARAVLLVTPEL
jgi:predicted chitinase